MHLHPHTHINPHSCKWACTHMSLHTPEQSAKELDIFSIRDQFYNTEKSIPQMPLVCASAVYIWISRIFLRFFLTL